MSERTNLKNSFAKLQRRGYFTRKSFWCCNTCAWSALTKEQAEKTVFYNKQDADRAWDNNGNVSQFGIHLSWNGDGKEICKVLRDSGLLVEWDGSEDKRILLKSGNVTYK